MARGILAIVVLFLTAHPLAAQSFNGIQLFDAVAAILEQQYINPRAADIPSIIATYRADLKRVCPQVTACQVDKGRMVIQQMLASFDDAHLVLYNDLLERQSLVGDPNVSGRFGIFLTDDMKALYVNDVYPDSPASRADILVGDTITAVNGKSAEPSTLQRSLHQINFRFPKRKLI